MALKDSSFMGSKGKQLLLKTSINEQHVCPMIQLGTSIFTSTDFQIFIKLVMNFMLLQTYPSWYF